MLHSVLLNDPPEKAEDFLWSYPFKLNVEQGTGGGLSLYALVVVDEQLKYEGLSLYSFMSVGRTEGREEWLSEPETSRELWPEAEEEPRSFDESGTLGITEGETKLPPLFCMLREGLQSQCSSVVTDLLFGGVLGGKYVFCIIAKTCEKMNGADVSS